MSISKNSFTGDLLANEILKGRVEKTLDKNTIKVTVDTTHSGNLKIYQSLDGKVYNDYDDSYTITSKTHKQVAVKGKYFYVHYENGNNAVTNFRLYTTLTNIINNEFDVKLTNDDVVTVEGLNFDVDGNLKVTGISGGGGSGDASSANQLLQIEQEELINNKLQTLNQNVVKCDTDNIIIDSSDPVQIVGLAKVHNTLNNAFLTVDNDQALRVTNINNITGFSLESTQEQIGEELYTFRAEQTPLQHEQGYADILTDGASMSADSNPPFTYHPTVKGFYYQNSVSGGASNLYFYANTQAKQKQYTISELMNSYAVVKLASMSATNTLPFLVVYSKPQNDGLDATVWYRSKWIYTIPNSAQLSAIGQEFMIYWGELPSMKIHPNVHRIQATLASSQGQKQQNEILNYLTINTDSSATVNSVKVIYSNVGYTTAGGLVHDIELGYGKEDKVRQVTEKIDNLNSTIGNGVYLSLDGNVSGLKLKSTNNDGSADVNVINQIDTSLLASETTLNNLSTLVTNQSAFNRFQTESQVTDGKLDTIISNMSLTNFNINNLTKCDTDNISIPSGVSINGNVSISGNVTVDNASLPVTGQFWQETQPVSISGTVPISTSSHLDCNIFGSHDSNTWHHILTTPQGKILTNSTLETDANGSLTSTLVTGTENYNALDVKVKGTTSVSGGVTSTLSTSDNGLLTSTLSGTGNSIHSLDVAVKNNVSVQNVASSKLDVNSYAVQYGSYNNLVNNQTINPYSASSSLDVSAYSYYMGYYTSTFMGFPTWPQVFRIQYSFDNINWYNLFNTQVSPSPSGGLNVATIYKQDIPGINYLRFYNDTAETLTNVNITIMGASL